MDAKKYKRLLKKRQQEEFKARKILSPEERIKMAEEFLEMAPLRAPRRQYSGMPVSLSTLLKNKKTNER